MAHGLGTKEHGGRVRGVGGSAKIKDVFGSGINKNSGVVSVDELAKITQDITKKVQKEFEEKMNHMMNLKLEGIFSQLKQMGVSLPDDIGTSKNEVIRSSCQSVDREDHFSILKSPALCSLWVIHSEKERVVVARGTVFPSNSQGSNMLHNNPIAPLNVKVSVDDVVADYQLTPLPVPCEEHETVGNAAGSFVQWPKDLVTLGQDPISLEKQKGHVMNPKRTIQMSKKVESKGSVTAAKKTPTLLNDDINSSENCRSLRFLLNKRPSNKKDDVFKFQEDGKDPIHIGPEDVDQFLKMSCLNTSILEFFSKYVNTLCKDNMFAFMSPSRLTIPHIRDYQRQNEAAEYLSEFLVANKDKRFILSPYHQDNHWVLLLFCLCETTIYVFDPLKTERKIRLITPARTAFKLYASQGGARNNKKEFLWHHVECPQQEGGTECGYFVMKYMHDIVMLCQKNPNNNWKVGLASKSYTKKEINEIRELWEIFFILECL